MITKINSKIQAINESLDWLKQYKPDVYEQRFVALVQERSRLRKILEAKKENPGIAAYGESQKGKSYLMGNLLQQNGKPFMVSVPTENRKVDFVRSINPRGDKREATGVVTRFTAFNGNNKNRYSPEYPVLMKLLSVADIAMILCDGYFNDLMDYQSYSDLRIREMTDEICNKYKERNDIDGCCLIEDDILDIKAYIKNNINNAHCLNDGANSNIFDKIALIIRRVPIQELPDVLSFLWHENAVITQMFRRLITTVSRLGFAREAYLPIEAVLHHGVNQKTIMSVKCLKALDDPNFDLITDVYVRLSDNSYKKIEGMNKSEIAAIAAEIAYKVDDEYLSTTMQYCEEMLPNETRVKLDNINLKKDVINVSDLLDFPGARNRLNQEESMLLDFDPDEESSNLVQLYLRGKVAYLFSNYCTCKTINILMFCHDDEGVHVTDMYSVIRDWVNACVGKNTESRRKTLDKSEGISPLFVVATKFNIDMATVDSPDVDSWDAIIAGRWEARFNEVLYTNCFKAGSVDWFRNWTNEGVNFKNCYLLRDFKYSGCHSKGNNIYDGYDETDLAPKETKLVLEPSFYNQLRESFVSNKYVKMFFEDPIKAWDLAATINNDGALYIIEKLCVVAKKMSEIRDSQFEDDINECSKNVYKLMVGDYEPEDETQNTLKDIKTAKSVMRELDFACNNDNYYFGHLIQCLQVKSDAVYNMVHNMIKSPKLISSTSDFNNYELISSRCKGFAGCNSIDEKWKCLMKTYELETKDEAEDYLKKKGIRSELLFNIKKIKRSNSAIIAQAVYDAWIEYLHSSELVNQLCGDSSFDESVLLALVNRITKTAEDLQLNERMASEVSKYLDVIKVGTANSDLVGDVLSHIINSFVVDMGYSYRTEDEIVACKSMAESYQLDLFNWVEKGYEDVPEEDKIASIFLDMLDNPQTVTQTFSQNYNEWMEYMFVSYILSGKMTIKNPEANSQLGMIISKLK